MCQLGLIEFVTGRVTPASFAKKYMAVLRTVETRALHFDTTQFAVRIGDDSDCDWLFLRNFYAEYGRAPRLQRDRVLRSMVLQRLQQKQDFNDPTDRASLLPVIRDSAHPWFTQRQLQTTVPGKELRMHHAALGQNHTVMLVLDSPTAMRYVTALELETLQMDFDAALQTAMHNLRDITSDKWLSLGGHAYVGQWNDTYDCSRILLPDLIYRLELPGRPVALMPCRGMLFIASESVPQGQLTAITLAKEALEHNTRWTSADMLVLNDGRWEPFVPSDPQVLKVQKEIATRIQKSLYDQQKDLLHEDLQRAGKDIFVANYMAYQKTDSVFSLSTWSKGVEAWIPKTDYIVFVDLEAMANGQSRPSTRVDWDTAHRYLEALMIPVPNVSPPRFHVSDFPGAQMILEMAEVSARQAQANA